MCVIVCVIVYTCEAALRHKATLCLHLQSKHKYRYTEVCVCACARTCSVHVPVRVCVRFPTNNKATFGLLRGGL